MLSTTLADRLPKAVVTPIEATFLAWVDVRAYSMDNKAIIQHYLDAGVLLAMAAVSARNQAAASCALTLAVPVAAERGLASLGCRCFRYGLTGGTNEGFGQNFKRTGAADAGYPALLAAYPQRVQPG